MRRSTSSISVGIESISMRSSRRGLVDQVDRLVGQEAVGDVAAREQRRGDDRRVLDAHAVVHLVALLEPAQDRDRVLHGRLVHEHGLEAALERGVLLDVLAVLVERGGADRAQLAAGEHRLEQVGGVDRALGGAGADDRVQLVHEQDHLALGLGDLLEHGLQPVLELAAVLGAGDQRADVERDHALALEALGHVARHDPLGEALGDGGLAHAGLADQHRVVLGAAARAPGSRGGSRRRARSPGRACPARPASVRSRPKRSSAWYLSSGFWSVTRCGPRTCSTASRSRSLPTPSSTFGSAASASSRCSVETYSSPIEPDSSSAAWSTLDQLGADRGRRGGVAGDRGERVERLVGLRADPLGVDVRPPQHGHDDAAVLLEQRGEQVVRRHLRVAARGGEPLRGCEGLLGLDGEAISLHRKSKCAV